MRKITEAEPEVARVAAALRTAIRLSGVSQREVERRLDMGNGYLTRILAGQVELRMAVVLSVCDIVGLPAGEFFAALFPPASAAPPESLLARGLTELHPGPARRRDPEDLLRELRGFYQELKALVGSEGAAEHAGPEG